MIVIKNIFKICFVIIGTIIGAGFASGKEIYAFFCIYGIYGFFGIFISNLIIGIVIFFTLLFVKKNNIKSYSEFINHLVGENKLLNYTINNIINVFLLISFIVMVSGFGAYFNQEFSFPAFYGSILICLFAFITFFKNLKGIISINCFLIPILIFLIFLLGIRENIFRLNLNKLILYENNMWYIKCILYASYNSITLIPIIINLSSFIQSKKQIKLITSLTIIFMSTISIIIYSVLCINMPTISHFDIPIVYIANRFRQLF